MELQESTYVNIKTQNLIKYLQLKYENRDYNLNDGLNIATQYLSNFGFLFEERDTGPFCHILDI